MRASRWNRERSVFLYAALGTWIIHYFLISNSGEAIGFSASIFLSGALTAGSLYLIVIYARLARLFLLLSLASFLFVHFMMMQLEAYIFELGSMSLASAMGLLVLSLVLVFPFLIASFFLINEPELIEIGTLDELLSSSTLTRLAICGVSFPIIYFLAGISILPFVREFYSELIPPFHELMLWQWLRGIIFTLASIPLILNFLGSSVAAATIFAVVFPVLGGVAPLLLPNAAMPADVRLVHGFEITASYVVYGAILGFLLYPIGSHSSAKSDT